MDHFLQLRILESMLFSASDPVDEKHLRDRMPEGADVTVLLEELQGLYANRGVHLMKIGKGWAFRTAEDLAPYLRVENVVSRRLSRAAIETLSIIAYHQPITRAEIEEMRGVALSRGTLDLLLEVGWIRPRGRRRTAGRPVTWGTSEAFLDHFGLENVDSLPGVDELKAAGLLERKPGFGPLSAMREQPTVEEEDEAELTEDEMSVAESELDSMEEGGLDEDFEEAIEEAGEEEAETAEASEPDGDPDAVGDDASEDAGEDEPDEERPTAELVHLPRRAQSGGGS